jgi:site-specific DNA-cytosine methylase
VAAAITVAYRAVGNAVPPTFGAALGREIVAAEKRAT